MQEGTSDLATRNKMTLDPSCKAEKVLQEVIFFSTEITFVNGGTPFP